MFGSIIDEIGRKDGDLYLIKELLLQEVKPNGIIDSSWLTEFVCLNLTDTDDIPNMPYVQLTNKKFRVIESSPIALEELTSDDDDDDDEDNEESFLLAPN